MTTFTRSTAFLYRLDWQPLRLGWSLSYDGQEWAFISAYLPGRPQMTEHLARQWADSLLGCPQPWRPDGTAVPAHPAPAGDLSHPGASTEARP
ncbi:hypothetical protein [Streptomyces daghestanicus]|nr:hypothetical protein [Streptomyces daghestanicus]